MENLSVASLSASWLTSVSPLFCCRISLLSLSVRQSSLACSFASAIVSAPMNTNHFFRDDKFQCFLCSPIKISCENFSKMEFIGDHQAIKSRSHLCSVSSCAFIRCASDANGGGIDITAQITGIFQAIIEYSAFTNCSAIRGGAMYFKGSAFEINGMCVSYCSAVNAGHAFIAMLTNASNCRIRDLTVFKCPTTKVRCPYCVCLSSSITVIKRTNMTDNHITGLGSSFGVNNARMSSCIFCSILRTVGISAFTFSTTSFFSLLSSEIRNNTFYMQPFSNNYQKETNLSIEIASSIYSDNMKRSLDVPSYSDGSILVHLKGCVFNLGANKSLGRNVILLLDEQSYGDPSISLPYMLWSTNACFHNATDATEENESSVFLFTCLSLSIGAVVLGLSFYLFYRKQASVRIRAWISSNMLKSPQAEPLITIS